MIAVLISTLYNRLLEIKPNQFPKNDDVYYVVSCQGVPEHDLSVYENKIKQIFGDKNHSHVFIQGYGLSRNRNAAINLLMKLDFKGRYFYISDDDIELCLDGIQEVVEFASASGLDMVAGKIATLDMRDHKQNYSSSAVVLNKLSAARVSSVEMVLSRTAVEKCKLRFDEQFGLGAKYPSGEEYIFVTDLLDQGCRAAFYPAYLCKHPPVTSGHDFYSTPEKIMAKGAMFRRVFGFLGAITACTLFTFKKYRVIVRYVSLTSFYYNILKGMFKHKVK